MTDATTNDKQANDEAPLDPTNLIVGRRVRFMITGWTGRRCEAVVTDKKDRDGWHVLKVDAPADHKMFGAELRCEDYILEGYV